MLGLMDLRQRRYPPEFRISAPEWPDSEELLRTAITGPRTPVAAPVSVPPAAVAPLSLDFLADACTGLWRLRTRMLQPGTDRPLDEMRRAYRHLESTWDALAQAGVEIIDHTGAPFDVGLALKVIAYQPTPGITSQRVVETIKPTVYFRKDRLQMGEVIVATPDSSM